METFFLLGAFSGRINCFTCRAGTGRDAIIIDLEPLELEKFLKYNHDIPPKKKLHEDSLFSKHIIDHVNNGISKRKIPSTYKQNVWRPLIKLNNVTYQKGKHNAAMEFFFLFRKSFSDLLLHWYHDRLSCFSL